MRFLLDAHVALWAITDSPKLSAKARALILSPANEIHVSAASIWEIAIKHGFGRRRMPVSGTEAARWFSKAGYTFLPVSAEHAALTETSHHTTTTRLTASWRPRPSRSPCGW